MIDKAKNLKPDVPELRRGSEIDPRSKDLPKMKMTDFNLLVVLGKGSFGKVGIILMWVLVLIPVDVCVNAASRVCVLVGIRTTFLVINAIVASFGYSLV